MKNRFTQAAVLALSLLSISGGPRPRILCEGFLPPNSMRIPVGDIRAKGIDGAMFNAVLDKVQEIYGPIIAKHGGNLVINRLWDDATVNASAEQWGDQWILNMYGGLARHPSITYDGFALVACHELGHHLGGFPKIGGGGWASNEGEADYHATLKCLRRVLPDTAPLTIDPLAVKSCTAIFGPGGDRNHCERDTMAGVSVSTLLAELGGSPTPTLGTPDPSAVDQTNDEHPAAQCRLDTYFQGSLCTKPVSEDLSDSSPVPGACTSPAYTVGLRSRCWYKPPTLATPGVASRPVTDEEALKGKLESLKDSLLSHGI